MVEVLGRYFSVSPSFIPLPYPHTKEKYHRDCDMDKGRLQRLSVRLFIIY